MRRWSNSLAHNLFKLKKKTMRTFGQLSKDTGISKWSLYKRFVAMNQGYVSRVIRVYFSGKLGYVLLGSKMNANETLKSK